MAESNTTRPRRAWKEGGGGWSPVATTLASSVFPEDHDLSLGVFGYAGTATPPAALLGGELDCLLVLGSGQRARHMHWTLRERTKAFMILVNTDMDELTANGDLGQVVREAAMFLDLMQERAATIAPALQAGEPAGASSRQDQGRAAALRCREHHPGEDADPSGHRDRGAAQGAPMRDGIVLVDSGAHRAFAAHYLSAYAPRKLISATNLGPMGWQSQRRRRVKCARPTGGHDHHR